MGPWPIRHEEKQTGREKGGVRCTGLQGERQRAGLCKTKREKNINGDWSNEQYKKKEAKRGRGERERELRLWWKSTELQSLVLSLIFQPFSRSPFWQNILSPTHCPLMPIRPLETRPWKTERLSDWWPGFIRHTSSPQRARWVQEDSTPHLLLCQQGVKCRDSSSEGGELWVGFDAKWEHIA